MKRIYLLFVVMIMAVPVIKAQTPIQMNDKLAIITDTLYSKGQKWGLQFNEAYKDGNYGILKPLSRDLLSYINSKIIYVQNMKDVKNSKPLRMAMLDLLACEKQMITEGFRPFDSFDANTTKEQVQAALDNLTEKSKVEGVCLKKFGTAQEVYAAENGFRIESGTEQ